MPVSCPFETTQRDNGNEQCIDFLLHVCDARARKRRFINSVASKTDMCCGSTLSGDNSVAQHGYFLTHIQLI